jgi:hypothetical protein
VKFLNYLDEERSHPGMNLKFGLVEQLQQYRNDQDVYISYTELNKIGINPKFEFNTPLGIYFYPLETIWENVVNNTVPYAAERPYVYVVKATGLLDLNKYTRDMLWDDIEKLKLGNSLTYTKEFKKAKSDSSEIPGIFIFYLTHNLAKKEGGNTASRWTQILREELGYKGIRDTNGIIHPNEPIQAIIFSTRDFKVIDKLENKRREDRMERDVVTSLEKFSEDIIHRPGYDANMVIDNIIRFPKKIYPTKEKIYIIPQNILTDMSVDDFNYILKLKDEGKIVAGYNFFVKLFGRIKEPKQSALMSILKSKILQNNEKYRDLKDFWGR